MTRFLFPVLFLLALVAHGGISRAEDAAPAAKSEAQLADEAAAEKATQKEEKVAEEEIAEEKAVEEKAAEKVPEKAAETAKEETEKKEEAPKEEEKKAETAEEKIPKEIQDHQKASEEVFKLTKTIAESLGPEEQKHFFVLYNNYNLIGTVKMVKEDVGNAVKSCGENNPDMKEGLDKRFTEWDAAVSPVIKDADANITNMVAAQDYAKSADIKKIFKGLDKTRKMANKQIDKTPVTTKDACEYLQEKMTDTQENFIRLLQSTLMSVPQLLPSVPEPAAGDKEEEIPAKAEEKIEEKAEEKPAEAAPEAAPEAAEGKAD